MTMLVSKFSLLHSFFTLLWVRSVLDGERGTGARGRALLRSGDYGWMSIRTLSEVIIQISTMSALVTAMQPSVQSCEA
jgi:hypothetical protein